MKFPFVQLRLKEWINHVCRISYIIKYLLLEFYQVLNVDTQQKQLWRLFIGEKLKNKIKMESFNG